MSPIILKNNIDTHNIEISDITRYNCNHYSWPIKYNGSNMCIQSCYLNMTKYNKNFNNISLSTYHKPIQSSKKKFISLIRNIDKHMITQINTLKKKIKYAKKILYRKSYIVQNKYIYYNFSLQQFNKKIICNVYDEDKHIQDLEYIEPGCDIYTILWLKNIWLKDNKAGLNYIVVQLKVYKPIIYTNKCLIIEDNDIFVPDKKAIVSKDTSEKVDPLYAVYFKMKKMGVPIQAIQMKMKLAGHDPNILTGTKYLTTTPNISKAPHRISPIHLLQGITSKKLKKVNIKKNQQDRQKRILQKCGVGIRRNGIPTLDEIIQTRNKLKKIR